MTHRRLVLGGLAALALCASAIAAAAGSVAFTPAALDAAKASGKPILIEITAPWCPTCKAQRPILSELRAQDRFKDLAVLEVDFDSQKDALRLLNAQRQSTLIVFKRGTEVGRSVGDTDPDSIRALLEKAL